MGLSLPEGASTVPAACGAVISAELPRLTGRVSW
ncbi:MAG: hypothetical protein AVDCRST_MAG12-1404 [uncultured Rubrobacteraceae bacterium]|uniref:Uncharacterized protein n=1 Tax=uncultured Rubrobacteraceae bacterium TaxID=349277 RepID=A0A6J4RRQ9_9ACTN|nr:MAG: hypothetical protein AVDCRST_MAG12-1404 [uncultured Rubrobacteraceae bacterium]